MTFSRDDKLYEDFDTPDSTVFDEEAINNSVKNILLTRLGTMPGRPDFGSDLMSIPFEPNDASTREIIKNVVKQALDKWEPRVIFKTVNVVSDKNNLRADIIFRYVDSQLEGNVSVDIFN